jgi:hypothetical protein
MNCIKIYKLYIPVIGGIFSLSFNGNGKFVKKTPENSVDMYTSSYEDFPIIIPEHHANKHQQPYDMQMTIHRNNYKSEKYFMNLQNIDSQEVELQENDSQEIIAHAATTDETYDTLPYVDV